MAISGQQNINIGQPNNPANSDSLYTAFNTIQNNFTQLFENGSPITSIVPGQGIQISNTLPNSYAITNTGVLGLVAGRNITITTLSGTPGSNGTLIINSTGTGGNGGGTVDSVGIASNTLAVSNSPITTDGNIEVDLLPITGVAGSYRNANITVDGYGRITTVANGTSSGTVTSVGLSAGNGISIGGGPITTSGTMTVTNTGVTSIVAGSGITINQSNGAVTINSTGGGGNGGGTVTRVSVTSNTLTVTGSPIVSSGVIDIELPANLTTNVLTANTTNIANIVGNQLYVNTSNSNLGITVTTASNNALSYGFASRKARGTINIPAPALTNDILLNVQSLGYTSFSKYQNGGGMQVLSNGNATTGSSYVPTIVNINSTSNSALEFTMSLDDRGNLILPGRTSTHIYGNISNPSSYVTSRARGTDSGNIDTVEVGDTISRDIFYAYTGNGTTTIDGVNGFTYAGGVESTVTALPGNSGQYLPSNYIVKTVNASNVVVNSIFTSNGNLSIVGAFVGSRLQINTSDSDIGAVVSTSTNTANITGYVSRKARGTVTSPTAALSGDVLLNLEAQGLTSFGNYGTAGFIQVVSNGVATSNTSFVPSIVTINSTGDSGIDYTLSLDDAGNVIVPGRISRHMYSDLTAPSTEVVSRARGTDYANIATIQLGDSIEKTVYYGYTGNGTTTIDNIPGWSYAGGTQVDTVALPATSGAFIPSNFVVKVVSNANTILTSTFNNLGNLTIPGTFVGDRLSVTGNITVADNVVAKNVVTAPLAFANLVAVAGARTFVSDANLVAANNFGAQITGGGSNTVPVWSDGTNWYIG